MKKKVSILCILCLLLSMGFAVIACKDPASNPTLATFDVQATLTVDLGAQVTVPTVTATDSAGNAVQVSVAVTDKDGAAVTLTDNAFTAAVAGDGAYVITYSVTVSGVPTSKTTSVNVRTPSETVTAFDVPALEDVYAGEVYLIKRMYGVLDNGDKINATYAVEKDGQPVTVTDDTFVPAVGTYTITYTITHASLTGGTQSKTLTVRASARPDTTAPTITVPDSALLDTTTFAYKTLRDTIAVADDTDADPSVTVKLLRNGVEVETPADTLTAKAGDVFTIAVTATDASANQATAEARFAYIPSELAAKSAKLYDFTSLELTDFEAKKDDVDVTIAKDSTNVFAAGGGAAAQSVKVPVEGKAALSFKNLAVKFIDDKEYAILVVYASAPAAVTFHGRGTVTAQLTSGENAVRINRAQFGEALYDRTEDDAAYDPTKDKSKNQFNNFNHKTANVAATDGDFRLEFTADSADVYVEGLFAMKGSAVRTDLIDLTTATALTDYSYPATDAGSKNGVAPDLTDSAVFAGSKAYRFTYDGTTAPTRHPYFYIKNDITNRATDPVSIATFDYVTLVFTYTGPDLGSGKTPKISLEGNHYTYLHTGINVLTIEKQNFAGLVTNDGTHFKTGTYDFYFYLQFQDLYNVLKNSGESMVFTVTLDAVYGLHTAAEGQEQEETARLASFNVPAPMSVDKNAEVTVPAVKAVDSLGNTLRATAAVADKDGTPVALDEGKFTASKSGQGAYVITYTVTVSGTPYTKTTAVNVQGGDETAPTISGLAESALLTSGTFDFAAVQNAVTVTDDTDQTPDKEIEVFLNGVKVQTPEDTMTAAAGDVYTVIVTATDEDGNTATASARFSYLPADAVAAATALYDFDALDTADFTAKKDTDDVTVAADTEHVLTTGGKSLKLTVDGEAKLTFEDIQAKFIDDKAFVALVVYASAPAEVTFFGRGTFTAELSKGVNAVRVDRDKFGEALYDRAADDEPYDPTKNKNQNQFNNFYNKTANVAATDGKFSLAFAADAATEICVEGLLAMQGSAVRTDLIDLTTTTNYTDYSTTDGGESRGITPSLGDSTLFAGSKAHVFTYDGTTASGSQHPYFYIKNDITNRATDPVSIATFDYVTLVFTYTGPDLGNNKTPKISLEGNHYTYLHTGINVLTIEKQYFTGLVTKDGTHFKSGNYDFYFYLQFQDLYNAMKNSGESMAFTVTLDAVYGLTV